jgi:hypothetical protein
LKLSSDTRSIAASAFLNSIDDACVRVKTPEECRSGSPVELKGLRTPTRPRLLS